ncbi:hypothetical protein A3709_20295 [Halioglobus sp. HI00S01]|uniref:hypothetical protein n=1 Tax=Halioglobus sp. HI00S01 TaxID=1822214 RepID=UPI0007C3A54A|nr:hypothetical protein [Halioglobus sp. HI00S01]KZX57954.1 hypothetical protein A3709_20295 [Halioglobus sp. HI00S01]
MQVAIDAPSLSEEIYAKFEQLSSPLARATFEDFAAFEPRLSKRLLSECPELFERFWPTPGIYPPGSKINGGHIRFYLNQFHFTSIPEIRETAPIGEIAVDRYHDRYLSDYSKEREPNRTVWSRRALMSLINIHNIRRRRELGRHPGALQAYAAFAEDGLPCTLA